MKHEDNTLENKTENNLKWTDSNKQMNKGAFALQKGSCRLHQQHPCGG